MKKLSTTEIRNLWLNFFKKYNHLEVPSVSLIPENDKSLLWINSGVATLKRYFDGRSIPPSPRMVNSQKAIRTNDIENVGITARHHTFFEMLGNFSIGDYFKKEAIAYAWEFLTSTTYLDLDKSKLYITVFKDDIDAFNYWVAQGVNKDHIILGERSTNFWDLGQGPCGPNSEVFYDRGPKYDLNNIGLKLLKEDLENDRYVEIWNIVFSQYNNDGKNNYEELPTKNIDTGAGLERIASIVQEAPTNFDTDIFLAIINKIESYCDKKYVTDNFFKQDEDQKIINTAFKVVADHLRSVTFAIADGANPGNNGRDYVIRRLIRRALRFGKKLGIKKVFLFEIVATVVSLMKDYYPYLEERQTEIASIIKIEEERFSKTLTTGEELLTKIINNLKVNKEKTINGELAFKLYDTYGFPIELTTEIANEYNVMIEKGGFQRAMLKHQQLAKQSQKQTTAMNLQADFFNNFKLESEFSGYHNLIEKNAQVILIFKDNESLKELSDEGFVLFDKTPFYAESGGQAPDSGYITNVDNSFYAEILDVQKNNLKQHVHLIKVEKGTLKINQKYILTVNKPKRALTMNNHSATHLLFAALTKVIGHSLPQSGSFLNDKYLRFDFAAAKKPPLSLIMEAQDLANKWIKTDPKTEVIYTDIKKALAMGALSLEKSDYNENVRVVKLGDYSMELCGGTHVPSLSAMEAIQVTNYETKKAGVYRIEALTTNHAIKFYFHNKIAKVFNEIRNIYIEYLSLSEKSNNENDDLNKLKNYPDVNDDTAGLEILKTDLAKYQNILKSYKKACAQDELKNLMSQFNDISKDLVMLDEKSETTYFSYRFPELTSPKLIQEVAKNIIAKHQNTICFLATNNNKNQTVWAIFSGKLAIKNNYLANNYAKEIATLINGRGGGKPHMSMVSGQISDFETIKAVVLKK